MSIGYRAVVACGWVVNNAEVCKLDDDVCEDLMEYETLIRQNCYIANSDYIYVYGDYAFSCDDNTIYTPGLEAPTIDEYPDEIMKFYELFPNHAGELPEIHFMVQIH